MDIVIVRDLMSKIIFCVVVSFASDDVGRVVWREGGEGSDWWVVFIDREASVG